RGCRRDAEAVLHAAGQDGVGTGERAAGLSVGRGGVGSRLGGRGGLPEVLRNLGRRGASLLVAREVVLEEFLPGLRNRVRLAEIALVHLLHEPEVRTELRTVQLWHC